MCAASAPSRTAPSWAASWWTSSTSIARIPACSIGCATLQPLSSKPPSRKSDLTPTPLLLKEGEEAFHALFSSRARAANRPHPPQAGRAGGGGPAALRGGTDARLYLRVHPALLGLRGPGGAGRQWRARRDRRRLSAGRQCHSRQRLR